MNETREEEREGVREGWREGEKERENKQRVRKIKNPERGGVASRAGDSVFDAEISPGGNQMRGEERERGVEEKNREMGLNIGKTGVSSTAVIRIHFVEMVSRLRKPTSSLVPPFMIL